MALYPFRDYFALALLVILAVLLYAGRIDVTDFMSVVFALVGFFFGTYVSSPKGG
ncbi:MAG: hypothetical protein JRM97_09435 [Nitrososphaerota archaeon]|nr:hypothetical protein [Nitrososphaerota archaeon]